MTTVAVAKPIRHAAIEAWLERFRLAWEQGDAGNWIEWAFTTVKSETVKSETVKAS